MSSQDMLPKTEVTVKVEDVVETRPVEPIVSGPTEVGEGSSTPKPPQDILAFLVEPGKTPEEEALRMAACKFFVNSGNDVFDALADYVFNKEGSGPHP